MILEIEMVTLRQHNNLTEGLGNSQGTLPGRQSPLPVMQYIHRNTERSIK